jgi:hypothetical protein
VARIGPAANAKQNKKVFKLSSTGWRLVNAVHDRGATTDVNRFAKRAGSRTGSQSRFAPFHGAVERAGSSRRALVAALQLLPIRSFRLATPAITRGHLCLHKIWIDNIVPGGPMPMRCTEGATYSWRPPPNRQRLATPRRLYR